MSGTDMSGADMCSTDGGGGGTARDGGHARAEPAGVPDGAPGVPDGASAVSDGALWGEATLHAVRAFPVSGVPMPVGFLAALVRLKRAAARTNADLGLLTEAQGTAIAAAADRVLEGGLWEQFPVDTYQTGSATSSNMDANEVIARLATLDGAAGEVPPHEHVNRCQSSNDVVPSAMRIATAVAFCTDLLPALHEPGAALAAKTTEFWDVLKVAG